MSYAVKDKSISSGAPIECYEFIAQHKTWRYTSWHSPLTVDGDLYTPLPLTRTAIEVSSIADSPTTMDFNVPADHELAKTFCGIISPRELLVIVRRVHEGDDYSTEFKIEWTGKYIGAGDAGKWSIIKTASVIRSELSGYLSSIYYQKSCNHVLYDARCKVLRADFTEEAIITKIQSQIITVDNMVYPNDELVGGVMTNTRTGEQQGIISNNGNVLRIGYPFYDIVLGDTVELTLGCDHTRLGHCKTRFNNTNNYGGYDFIPEVNPFEKLPYTTTTKTTNTSKGRILPYIQTYETVTRSSSSSGSIRTITSWGLPAPGPKPVNSSETKFETSTSESGASIPVGSVGQTVPSILGRKLIANHNLIWCGNLRPVTETTTAVQTTEETVNIGGDQQVIKHTETVTTTSIVGYLADLQFGLCLGPDTILVGIFVNGSSIWNGEAGPGRTQINMPKSDTFFSESVLYFSGGNYDQAPEPLITTPDYPGNVGLATVFMKNVRVDRQMGQVSFEVRRLPNPLGLASGVHTDGQDINLMSAVTEIITNEWGFGGLDISNIDQVNFSAAANVFDAENNFAAIKIDSESGIAVVLASVQRQGDFVLFENPEIAKIQASLQRPSKINHASMKRFHQGNIVRFQNFEKFGWPDVVDQARAVFTQRDASYNEVPIFIQNTASASQSGRSKKTATLQYPFVSTKTLARTLLARDLAKYASPSYNFSITVNRDGASCLPGDFVSVTWPDQFLLNLPMHVISVRKQEINLNSVVLKLAQAKFPDTTPLFGPGGPTYDPGFDVSAKKPTGFTVLSAPFYAARIAQGYSSATINPVNYPIFFPVPVNPFQASFSIFQEDGANGIILADGAIYPCYGKLTAAIDLYDGFDDAIIPSVTIDGVIGSGLLTDIGEDGVRAGKLFLFVGNEIMSFETATDNGDGSWTFGQVHRALLDTVFEDHADNANVFITSNNFSMVGDSSFAYPVPGGVPVFVAVSNSLMGYGLIQDGLATDEFAVDGVVPWSPTGVRTLAPYRPHNTKINGNVRAEAPISIDIGDNITVTWLTRSRQSIDVVLMLDAAETPETNGAEVQKHYVYHRSAGGVVTQISGPHAGNTSGSVVMPAVATGDGWIYAEAEMELAGIPYKSLYQDRIPVTINP